MLGRRSRAPLRVTVPVTCFGAVLSTLYHLFDLFVELGSEGRRKDGFCTLYLPRRLTCVGCEGACSTVVHGEVGWLVRPCLSPYGNKHRGSSKCDCVMGQIPLCYTNRRGVAALRLFCSTHGAAGAGGHCSSRRTVFSHPQPCL